MACAAVLAVVAVWSACPAADEADLTSLRQRYEQAAMELAGWETDQHKLALEQYRAFLDQARDQLKKKYDLDGYDALKNEQERFAKDKTVPADVGAGVHPQIAAARKGYVVTIAGAKQKREERFNALTSRYVDTLDTLKKRLMDSDRMAEAVAVRDEVECVKKFLRPGAGLGPSLAVCQACRGTGKLLVTCTQCSGTGKCSTCQGRGERPGGFKKAGEDGLLPCLRCKRSGKCVPCLGTGKSESADVCDVCVGTGKVEGTNVVSSATNSR